jgi:hypothetical protein
VSFHIGAVLENFRVFLKKMRIFLKTVKRIGNLIKIIINPAHIGLDRARHSAISAFWPDYLPFVAMDAPMAPG